MSKNYLPTADGPLGEYSTNFYENLLPDPQSFGLSADQVAQFNTTRLRYLDLLGKSLNEATRTGVVIEQRDLVKRTLVNSIRTLVKVIQAYPAMTDDKRRLLKITVPKPRSPIGPPTDVPGMEIDGVDGHRVTAQLYGSDGRRRKPKNVHGAVFFSFVGSVPPENPALWKNEGSTTRTRITVEFPLEVPSDAAVWLAACWVNGKLQTGTACPPVMTYLNRGGMRKAA